MENLIIFGLATWRVASLLVREDGPMYLFQYIRKMAGIQHDGDGVPYMIPSNFFAQVLSCVWCASLWVGAWFYGMWFLFPESTTIIATALALSTMAIIIDRHLSP